MAPEYTDADVHGLYLVAVLMHDFWERPSGRIAKEIRLQAARFGLDPVARRRLQWVIER
jgi:hypothetical protein